MKVFQNLDIKIPNEVLVRGIKEGNTNEEVIYFLKQYAFLLAEQ